MQCSFSSGSPEWRNNVIIFWRFVLKINIRLWTAWFATVFTKIDCCDRNAVSQRLSVVWRLRRGVRILLLQWSQLRRKFAAAADFSGSERSCGRCCGTRSWRRLGASSICWDNLREDLHDTGRLQMFLFRCRIRHSSSSSSSRTPRIRLRCYKHLLCGVLSTTRQLLHG